MRFKALLESRIDDIIDYVLYRPGKTIDVKVKYKYNPGDVGSKEKDTGLMLTPNITPSINIIYIRTKNGDNIPLTPNEVRKVVDKIEQELKSNNDEIY